MSLSKSKMKRRARVALGLMTDNRHPIDDLMCAACPRASLVVIGINRYRLFFRVSEMHRIHAESSSRFFSWITCTKSQSTSTTSWDTLERVSIVPAQDVQSMRIYACDRHSQYTRVLMLMCDQFLQLAQARSEMSHAMPLIAQLVFRHIPNRLRASSSAVVAFSLPVSSLATGTDQPPCRGPPSRSHKSVKKIICSPPDLAE